MIPAEAHSVTSIPFLAQKTYETLSLSRAVNKFLYLIIFFSFFWCSEEHFSIFFCTVSGCDGGNRTRNIAVHTWCFSLLSYGRHPLSYGRHPWPMAVTQEQWPSPIELWPSPITLNTYRWLELIGWSRSTQRAATARNSQLQQCTILLHY